MNTTINIYELFGLMDRNDVLLIYQGLFDQGIVKSVVSMTERKLEKDKIDEPVRKKLFNVLVESLQNICKHQYVLENVQDRPFLIIGKTDTSINIVTGNLIEKKMVQKLSEKIDLINTMDKEGLKEFYKQSRLTSTISAAGGAGLGFIDMARKTGNKIKYRFYDVNEEYSYFVLNNTINN